MKLKHTRIQTLAKNRLQKTALSASPLADGAVFCVLDRVSHVVEPRFVGTCENLLNLGACWDQNVLRASAEKIIASQTENKSLHDRASKFIYAANLLLTDTYRLAEPHTDSSKIARFALKLAKSELGTPKGRIGKEQKRFLSAVTPHGYHTYYDTLAALAPRTYVIEDEYGVASNHLLRSLRAYALGNGYDIISCASPFAPKERLEHLIIPELELGFTTANARQSPPFDPFKRIHATRFMNTEELKEIRCRVSFNRKAAKQFIEESTQLVKAAKDNHDVLESYYISAMDFKKVNQMTEDLIAEILKYAEK